jgi:hypothetical protein
MSELDPLSVYHVLSNPLTSRVLTKVGVVMNHLYVREERLLAGESMDDLTLRAELDAMTTVPTNHGLPPDAEVLLLLTLALDFCDDTRAVVAGVCPWAPYACMQSIGMVLNLKEAHFATYERELAEDGALVRRKLVRLRPRPGTLVRLPGIKNTRTAFLDITEAGINLLMGVEGHDKKYASSADGVPSGGLRLVE